MKSNDEQPVTPKRKRVSAHDVFEGMTNVGVNRWVKHRDGTRPDGPRTACMSCGYAKWVQVT
jgi:hypothetical protein